MADYLSFADGVPISVPVPSDSEEDFNMEGVDLDNEEPEVRFNDPDVASDDLAVAPPALPEVSRKRPRDVDGAQDEEELIEGSGLFTKRPRIPGCPDMKGWLLKNKKPASLQDPDIRDHCAESLRFPSDVQKWAEYGKDDLPNALLGHFLEVSYLVLLFFLRKNFLVY